MNETDKLKAVELSILKKFIEICKKEKLKYYLIGGSCLGAVRHHGFIPWDDDIDVGMPRPDYDRFLEIGQEYLGEDLFLQTYKTDPQYINNFSKIRNSSTTFIEISNMKRDINHGIYIDVFPLDGGGQSEEEAYDNMLNMQDYSKRINMQFYLPPTGFKRKIKYYIKKIVYFSGKKKVAEYVERRDALYRKFSYIESDWVVNYGGVGGKKEIVPKMLFGDGIYGVFESIEVVLPQNYDAYLTRIYGDYMIPPPKEAQVPHHYCSIIDTEISYKEYLKKRNS